MKPLPSDPMALQARIFDTLLADIADRDQPGFARLDALRAVMVATSDEPHPSAGCLKNEE